MGFRNSSQKPENYFRGCSVVKRLSKAGLEFSTKIFIKKNKLIYNSDSGRPGMYLPTWCILFSPFFCLVHNFFFVTHILRELRLFWTLDGSRIICSNAHCCLYWRWDCGRRGVGDGWITLGVCCAHPCFIHCLYHLFVKMMLWYYPLDVQHKDGSLLNKYSKIKDCSGNICFQLVFFKLKY